MTRLPASRAASVSVRRVRGRLKPQNAGKAPTGPGKAVLESKPGPIRLKIPERAIKAQCLELLALYPSIRAWNQPAGVGRSFDGRRVIRYGVPGQADIGGLIAPDGRMLAIEVKTATGRLTEAQEAFRAMISGMGGLYLVVRSPQELADALKAAGIAPARWRGPVAR